PLPPNLQHHQHPPLVPHPRPHLPLPSSIPQTTYTTLEPWTRWTQTLAILEILHAATGLTRSPIFTTFTQIFARSVQVWAINHSFPELTSLSHLYKPMLFAWSLADTIRYLYFVVLISGCKVPRGLRWLRYSLFLVLYPIGIGSEWWLMFRATVAVENWAVKALFVFFLGLYGPGMLLPFSFLWDFVVWGEG
ncbi:PTPLA-domain-containing protein, partial [Aspergillus sclerotioniger CBS 115572]